MKSRTIEILLLSGILLAVSCGGSPPPPPPPPESIRGAFYASQGTTASASLSFAGAVSIVNPGVETAQLGISAEGFLFQDQKELLAYIHSMPAIVANEPDYQKAWRFLTARGYQYTPLTGSDQQQDPLLFINSLGYGYCDDFANVLATIWQWQGYQARIWGLNGHVVPEIQVNSQWMMFDANYGVYYRDSAGQIASVDELEDNPNLITQPVDPIYPLSNWAYDQVLYNIYSTTQDNAIAPVSAPVSRGMKFELPGHSTFTFPVASDPNTFYQDGVTPSTPLYYLAQMQIPSVAYDTVLDLPLFVVGVTGSGAVQIDNQVFEIGSGELTAYFAQFCTAGNNVDPVRMMTVMAGSSNVVISMSLSAFAVDGPTNPAMEIYQYNSGPAMGITYARSGSQTQAPVAKYLSNINTQLLTVPYKYISPVYMSGDLAQLY